MKLGRPGLALGSCLILALLTVSCARTVTQTVTTTTALTSKTTIISTVPPAQTASTQAALPTATMPAVPATTAPQAPHTKTTTPSATVPRTTSPFTTASATTAAPPLTTAPTRAVDLSNITLIGTQSGVNAIDERGLVVFDKGLGLLEGAAIDAKGQIWVVTNSNLMSFDGKGWTAHPGPSGVYILEDIAIDSTGRVWLGHHGGASVLEGGQWRTYSSDLFGLGQYADLVKDIAVDLQNRVWVATSTGVAVFNAGSWAHYDDAAGLTYNTVEAIAVDHQGRVWLGHTYGVDVFDGTAWTFYGEKHDKAPQIEVEALAGVKALAVDARGYVWAGTLLDGVSFFNGSAWQTYDSRKCFYGGAVNSITCDPKGRVWLGTNFGLAVFDGSQWFQYTQRSSALLSNEVRFVIVTGAGPSLPPAPALQAGRFTGKIMSSGQPVAGAKVVVCWETEMLYSGESPCLGDSYSAVTDSSGEFSIGNVPPYRYALAIQKPNGAWKIRLGYIYVVDGETTFLGSISI